MTAVDSVKEAMGLMKEAFEKMCEANRVMGRGPHSYYAEQMVTYADMLFNRYAPFKIGDRVTICKAPNCDNDWRHHAQDLVVGAKATVRSIDVYKGRWRIDVMLDEETWIDREGVRRPVSQKHTFCLHEEEIEHLAGEQGAKCS